MIFITLFGDSGNSNESGGLTDFLLGVQWRNSEDRTIENYGVCFYEISESSNA